jgi:hypothetical protein
MTAFVKSEQIIQDLLTTLNGTSSTSQQLKETLLRESNCDYSSQIITSLNSGEGDFPDAVRSLKQDTGTTLLHSAKRYFFNDKAAAANTAKHKFAFASGASQTQQFVLPIHGAQSRDLITSFKSLPPDYTINNQNIIIDSTRFTYLVNVKLSLIIYDGQNTPGPGHPAPSFTNVPGSSINDITSDLVTGSFFTLSLGFVPAGSATYVNSSEYGGKGSFVLGNQIAQFKRVELNASYMFVSHVPQGSSAFNQVNLNLDLSQPCCNFGSRGQHVGLFKSLPANDKLIDSSNYVDIICLGYIEAPV